MRLRSVWPDCGPGICISQCGSHSPAAARRRASCSVASKGDESLRLTSQMADYGVIFSDGVGRDYLEFNAGMRAEIDIADRSGHPVQ